MNLRLTYDPGKPWNVAGVERAISDAVRDSAQYAQDIIRERTPVRTGRLRASFAISGTGSMVTVSSALPYASAVESRRRMVADSEEEIAADLERRVSQAVEVALT